MFLKILQGCNIIIWVYLYIVYLYLYTYLHIYIHIHKNARDSKSEARFIHSTWEPLVPKYLNTLFCIVKTYVGRPWSTVFGRRRQSAPLLRTFRRTRSMFNDRHHRFSPVASTVSGFHGLGSTVPDGPPPPTSPPARQPQTIHRQWNTECAVHDPRPATASHVAQPSDAERPDVPRLSPPTTTNGDAYIVLFSRLRRVLILLLLLHVIVVAYILRRKESKSTAHLPNYENKQ